MASLASRVLLKSSLTFSLPSFRSVGFPDHRLIADITVEPAGKISVVYNCIYIEQANKQYNGKTAVCLINTMVESNCHFAVAVTR